MTAAVRAPRPGRAVIPAGTLVLADRPLRPGVDLTYTARFGDDVWPLTPAIHQLHHQGLSLDFTTIPAPFQTVCKVLFAALLSLDPPAGLVPPSIVTIRGHFSAVKQFLIWLDDRNITALADVAPIDLAGYGRHLQTQRVSVVNTETKRYAVRLFWLFRGKLHVDALPADPAVVFGMPYTRPTRRVPTENTTDRIPEHVLAPLMVWALRWIEDFADDILTACAHQQADQQTIARRGPLPVGQRGAQQRLIEVLDGYRQRGQRLPGQSRALTRRHRGPANSTPDGAAGGATVNITRLAVQARCHPATLSRPYARQLITDAAAELGVDADTYLPTPIHGPLDGRPWQPGIGTGRLPELARHLQTACYLVIAYLSGMRDSEVKHLRRGCLRTWRDQTGQPVRHKVTSLAFKGEAAVDGVEATWIVGAPVARAVSVLEALQPAEQPLLFAVLPTSHNRDRVKANTVKIPYSTNRDLAGFVAWITSYCTVHDRGDTVPDVNGRPWKLTTRQFRRTLAWFIARQPGGSIAGAIQYRHLSVQMFEGYAGTSASGFRHEVEAEQALQRGQKLLDFATGDHPRQLLGPAADEARTRLAAFTAHFPGKIVNDRKRLQRIMASHDPNIHPGHYVTCVYNPDRSLCHQDRPHTDTGSGSGSGSDAAAPPGPALTDCRPTRCRNVTLTPANAHALTQWISRIDAILATEQVLAPYLRDRLHQQREEVTALLGSRASAASTPDEPR
jgi:integrase